MTEQHITAQPSEPRQRPNDRTTWVIPAGLIVLSLVPVVAGAMPLTELISGISGMWMAVFSTRLELDMVVRLFFGAVMVTSIVLGLRGIVRRDFARHRHPARRGLGDQPCRGRSGDSPVVTAMRGMNGPLSSVWNVPPSAPTPPARVWRDWVLVAVLPMLIVLESVLRPDPPNLVATAVITAAGVATLMWRRAWPLLMFVIGFGSAGVFALVTGHEVQLYSSAYLLLLVYAVFRWGSGRAMLVARGGRSGRQLSLLIGHHISGAIDTVARRVATARR